MRLPPLRMASDKPTKPFARGAASSEIYDVLRDEILTLALAPGSPLDETGLSKRFSVSRSPVREALNRLLADRLVETLPNRSAIVAQVNLRNFAPFIQALDVQQRLATRLAARNRVDADIARLQALANTFNDSIEGSEQTGILQANYAFHMAVAEVGGNPYVTRHYGELLSEARRLLHIHVQFLTAVNRMGVLRDQHGDFVDAIARQDVAAADTVAHQHTLQFQDRLLNALHDTPDAGFDIGVSEGLGGQGR